MTQKVEQSSSWRSRGSWVLSVSLSLLLGAAVVWAALSSEAKVVSASPLTRDLIRVASLQTDVQALELGKPIERELAGGQTHAYRIALAAGQFLHVVVDQRGVDVVVTLFGPDGKQLVEVDSPNGTQGPEPLSWVTEVAGSYRLEVRSLEKDAAAGRYEVKMEFRGATPEDRTRVAAQLAFAEGEQLQAQRRMDALRQAIGKYQAALSGWRAIKDRPGEAASLHRIGYLHYLLDEYPEAIEYSNQVLPIWQELHEDYGEIAALTNLGMAYFGLNQKQKAIEFLNQALPLTRALKDIVGEGAILNNLGTIYRSLDDKQKALDFYDQALLRRRGARDLAGESSTLSNIGEVYFDQKEYPKAVEFANQALLRWREARDPVGEAKALDNIGEIYLAWMEPQKAVDHLHKAIEHFGQARARYRDLEDRQNEARALNEMGVAYYRLFDFQKALNHYDQALQLRRVANNRRGEAQSLHNIGALYADMGENQKARDNFEQSLAIWQALNDRNGQVTTLNSLGSLHSDLGEYQKAFNYFSQALPLNQPTDNFGMQGKLLNNLASVYNHLGEKQKALNYYSQSLRLFQELKDRGPEAAALSNIGGIYYYELHDKQKALDNYNQALTIVRGLQDLHGEATLLGNLGGVYFSSGETQKALDCFVKAIPLSQAAGDRRAEGMVLDYLGAVHSSLGDQSKALDYYNQALKLHQTVGSRDGEAEALFGMAGVERKRGDLTAARKLIEAAIQIIESLRTEVASQSLRATYLASTQKQFGFYIDLLMRLHQQNPTAGYDAAALQASERARARSLLEILTEARVAIRQGVSPALLERERSLQQQITAKTAYKVRLFNRTHTPEETVALAKEIEALTTQRQEVEGQIRDTSPRFAALTQPQPLSHSEIQEQVLDADTLLLEYSLGEERSFLWAVTSTTIKGYELPNRAKIEGVAKRLADALSVPRGERTGETPRQHRQRVAKLETDCEAAAAELSQMLLAPVAGQLEKKRLVIVSDGRLQYIPFAVLPKPSSPSQQQSAKGLRGGGSTPLIVDHEIVSLPSASTLAVLRRELAGRSPAPKMVAVLADPVFDVSDKRVKQDGNPSQNNMSVQPTSMPILPSTQPRTVQALRDADGIEQGRPIPRLYESKEEAEAIAKLAPAGMSKVALGFEASYATATSPEMAEYRYVHFATHGWLDDQQSELTGILLSLVDEQGREQNGLLRLGEVYNLKLPAEVVVLSACETALGKDVRGEGLVGLTRGFMHAGAARVVASLWKVDDEGTKELMKRFYEGMLGKQQLRPAAALRQAQLSMLRQAEWRSPYYWGAFMLQGEWR